MSRTVVNLDDELVKKIKEYTGLKKKVEVVNYAMAEVVRRREVCGILDLARAGKIKGEWHLKEWRKGRFE